MNRSKIIELLSTGPNTGVAFIVQSLDCMEVAEQEIARAQAEHPEHAATLRRVFGVAMPGNLATYGQTLYRAHVRELLDRVVDGFPFDLGTDAEVLDVLSTASLRAPLGSQAAALFERLFARMFPAEAATVLDGGPRAEPWQGASSELASEIKRKLRKKDRHL